MSVEATTDHLKQLTVNEENGTNGVHLQPNDETSYQTIGYDEEEAFEPKYGEKGMYFLQFNLIFRTCIKYIVVYFSKR